MNQIPNIEETHNIREEDTIEWQGKEYPICRTHEVVFFTETCPQCGKDDEQLFRNNIVSQFATFNLGEGIIEREQRILEAVLEISTNHHHQQLQKAKVEEGERIKNVIFGIDHLIRKRSLVQSRNGIEYCSYCEQAYKECSCPARNSGAKEMKYRILQTLNHSELDQDKK